MEKTIINMQTGAEETVPLSQEDIAAWEAQQVENERLKPIQCQQKAKELIAATDWAVLPDVGLVNVFEYQTYRSTLRDLIKNPVANPDWPTEPTPVWE